MDHTLITALKQSWTVSSGQNTSNYLKNKHHPWRTDQTEPFHVYLHTRSTCLSQIKKQSSQLFESEGSFTSAMSLTSAKFILIISYT